MSETPIDPNQTAARLAHLLELDRIAQAFPGRWSNLSLNAAISLAEGLHGTALRARLDHIELLLSNLPPPRPD